MSEIRENTEDESMQAIAEKLREAFKDEAFELVAELEAATLELENFPDDRELLGRIFRTMHTIKGSSAACGLTDIAAFTHELETFFDIVRKGEIGVNREIINLALSARDELQAMFDRYYKGGEANDSRVGEIVASLNKLLPVCGNTGTCKASNSLPGNKKQNTFAELDTRKDVTYRIQFRPLPGLLEQGADPVKLLNQLNQMGHCTITPLTDIGSETQGTDSATLSIPWEMMLTTTRQLDDIQDVFLFVQDHCELKIEVIDEDVKRKNGPDNEKLKEAFHGGGDRIQANPVWQESVRESRENRGKEGAASSVRVPSAKLDGLVNLVGELVTLQARLSQTVTEKQYAGLSSLIEDAERLTDELRDNALSIRMLPIGTTFSRFKRLVRDLATELGKEVALVTEGAETELDKTVIDLLGDSLVHLIRNSIDHGIEAPEIREAAGKPRCGTIRLSAEHSGANVLIRIEDDGPGIDTDAIRAKALEQGLMRADAELSERDLQMLIFAPGFSTIRYVTSISGRGVGLDVVKKTIDNLRGSIEVRSRKGAGTAITLKLPLTLAIIDGLLVLIGTEYFVVPLTMVLECVELTGEEQEKADHRPLSRHMINVRGEIVPYIRLREQFMIGKEPPAIEQVVITEVSGERVGFVVDHVIGSHQTVIKNLGKFYRDVEGISGATILGDGTVALILDVPKLVKSMVGEAAERMDFANTLK
jgi:two-component system chemotaxis sensor kinase CheA